MESSNTPEQTPGGSVLETPAGTPPAAPPPAPKTAVPAAAARPVPQPGAVVESSSGPINKMRRRIVWASVAGFLADKLLHVSSVLPAAIDS